jgi:hypothetical protein
MLPLLDPKQLTFDPLKVAGVTVVERATGWVKVTEAVVVHPFRSVTRTEYVPAVRFVISWVVWELLHA